MIPHKSGASNAPRPPPPRAPAPAPRPRALRGSVGSSVFHSRAAGPARKRPNAERENFRPPPPRAGAPAARQRASTAAVTASSSLSSETSASSAARQAEPRFCEGRGQEKSERELPAVACGCSACCAVRLRATSPPPRRRGGAARTARATRNCVRTGCEAQGAADARLKGDPAARRGAARCSEAPHARMALSAHRRFAQGAESVQFWEHHAAGCSIVRTCTAATHKSQNFLGGHHRTLPNSLNSHGRPADRCARRCLARPAHVLARRGRRGASAREP